MTNNYPTLLIYFNGENNSTVFIDEIGNSVTPIGNTKITTSEYKYGGSSGYFDGNGDYLIIPNSVFDFKTADFTIEFWCKLITNDVYQRPGIMGSTPYDSGSGFFMIAKGPNTTWGGVGVISFNGSAGLINGPIVESTTEVRNAGWKHIAITREDVTTRLFVDGILEDTHVAAGVANYDSTDARIMASSLNAVDKGYLNDLRITHDKALYTTNFDVPGAFKHIYHQSDYLFKFNLENNDTSIIKEYTQNKDFLKHGTPIVSNTQSKFGGYSGYFNGSSNLEILTSDFCLSSANNHSALGTLDFTIEAWVYCNSTNNFNLYTLGASGSGTGTDSLNKSGLNISATSNSTLDIIAGNLIIDGWSGYLHLKTSDNLPISGWCHLAIVSISNVPHVYINGIESTLILGNPSSSITNFNNIKMYSERNINIMSSAKYNGLADTTITSSGGSFCTGYIDDLRYTKGNALYTENFTPPNQEYYSNYFLSFINMDNPLTCAPNNPTTYLNKYISNIWTNTYRRQEEYDGGIYSISGYVTINNIPVSRQVILHEKLSKRIVASMWSDSITGFYKFEQLSNKVQYYIWCEDYEKNFTPVTQYVEMDPKIPKLYYINNIDFSEQTMRDPSYWFGLGKIWGVVTDNGGNPLSRRLVLLEHKTYIIVQKTISDVLTGEYEFNNLTTEKIFTVIAEDVDDYVYNDIIRAKVRAELV